MDVFIRNFVSKYLRLIKVYSNCLRNDYQMRFIFYFILFKKYSSESLIKLLSALEYTEAILEITAAKLFGEKFKWLIIFLTHLVKYLKKSYDL